MLRRDGRTQTQASTLVTNPVGRARMGSEEGRWTGGLLYRVLREGHFRHGRARLVSRWTGKARFGAPALERHRCRRGGTYRRDRATQERVGVQPGVGGVGGGRIRQYTAAGGAPVVCGVETFDTRRGWRVCCAGGQLGCIARALAVGGASARNMRPPAKEDDYVKRWKGWLFLRRRPGRPNGRRSARCFLRAVH